MNSAFRFVIACVALLPACALDNGSDDGIDTSSEAVTTRSANGPETPPPRESDLVVWLTPDAIVPMLSAGRSASWHDKTGKATITLGAGLEASFSGLSPHLGIESGSSSSFIRATLQKGLGRRPFSMFMVLRDAYVDTSSFADPFVPTGWLFRVGMPIDVTSTHFGLRDFGFINYLGLDWSPANQQTAGALVKSARVLTLHRHGMGVDVWVDGQPYYQSTSPVVYDAGGVNGPAQSLDFAEKPEVTVGDILVYDADLSAADVTNVQGYLRNRYGL